MMLDFDQVDQADRIAALEGHIDKLIELHATYAATVAELFAVVRTYQDTMDAWAAKLDELNGVEDWTPGGDDD